MTLPFRGGEATRPRHPDQLAEAARFRSRRGGAERRDPVIATPLVVELGRRPIRGLDQKSLLEHSLNRSIQGARAHPKRAVGARLDVLDDPVAVPILVGERQEDVERRGRQRQQRVHVLAAEAEKFVGHGGDYIQRGYIPIGYRRTARAAGSLRRVFARTIGSVDRTFLFVGALAGFSGVALGAFGAHGLRGRLAPDMLAVFETGVRYHLYHALALVLTSLLLARLDGWIVRTAGWCFAAGIVLFSGSLYGLALSGMTVLGAVTPLGGLAFLAGWACLAFAAAAH